MTLRDQKRHNKSLNRSGGWARNLKSTSLAAARLAWSFVPKEVMTVPMGHKILKDHAHTICQMFVGWRMSQDLALFATIPEGELTLDIVQGTCTHDSSGPIDTYIAGEIASWFKHRMTVHRIAESEILHATLIVQLRRIHQSSKRYRGVTFDWRCDGIIRTKDREYRSQLHEPHTWIPAATSNPNAGTNKAVNPSGGSGLT